VIARPASNRVAGRWQSVRVPGVAAKTDWAALLRGLDEPGVLGQEAGVCYPRGFDRAAQQARFDRLGALLSDAYGQPLSGGQGPYPEASFFGWIHIPPEATLTRAKRTRIPFGLTVIASNFGDLATYVPSSSGPVEPTWPKVHPDDQSRVEGALMASDYVVVPHEVLQKPYDGPNEWLFGTTETWFGRFFSVL
jgi:hypothetical protein